MYSRIIALLMLFLVSAASFAQGPAKPDLLVVISIDQFPYSYIERFQPYLGAGGFRRVLNGGANFTNARYTYATTVTGPGHAAIGTGYLPSRSGIVANTWFDRATGMTEYCVADEHSRPPYSPVNLACDSLGDRIQQRYSGSKVYGISLKDRAAILMAGRNATAAYWFDTANGGFTSSTYYRSNKAMLDAYNASLAQLIVAHPVWEQSSYIPPADLQKLTHDADPLLRYKTAKEGLGVSFPHRIRTLEALTHTPFGNEMAIGLAKRVIEQESLGAPDGSPDLVFISLSSPDYLGHLFGPDSLEVADTVVRTDRDLESFFGWLDEKFSGRVTVAISADHGVQSIPEVARAMGRDAGRVDLRNPNAAARTWSDLAPERRELETRLAAELGMTVSGTTPVEKTLVLFFEEPGIYLNWVRIRELNLDGERVKRLVKSAMKNMKGVSGAFTNSELMMLNRDASELESAVRQSFRPDRSGDVLVTLKPGYIWSSSETGTSHGQPVDADQHVPVMLWGAGVAAGTYDELATPASIAKTLGALVGVDAGSPSSEQLPCVAAASTARR